MQAQTLLSGALAGPTTARTFSLVSALHVASRRRVSEKVSRSQLGCKPQWRNAIPANESSFCRGVEPFRLSRKDDTRAALSSSRPVVANWNQEVEWSDVEVTEVEKEAESLFAISLNITDHPKLQEGYTKAGQYVQVKVGDSKPAFLAIASPPQAAKEGRMEFLVKAVEGSTAELLSQVKAGQQVAVSQVMGKGFNTDALSPPDSCTAVYLFATGSGISPIRALIEAGFGAKERADVQLFFGVRNLPCIPYMEKFKEWEDSGVQINLVLSQPAPAWDGTSGRVQGAFKELSQVLEGDSTGAVLCGHKGMTQDVIAMLKEAGVPQERILLNF